MEKQIEDIANSCFINEKRIRHELNGERMATLYYQMNELTHNREIALYASKLETYYELIQKKVNRELIDNLEDELYNMEDGNSNVFKYRDLRMEYNHLRIQNSVYAKSINVDFRNKLKSTIFPHIFVYQEDNGIPLYRHIIDNETYLIYETAKTEIIYPQYDLKSNREYRHFYNKISYNYLEQLSIDGNQTLENKHIGKIRVKKV